MSQGLESGRLCTLQGWAGKSASEAAVPPTHACFTKELVYGVVGCVRPWFFKTILAPACAGGPTCVLCRLLARAGAEQTSKLLWRR